jgi:hypothetical protein
MVDYEFRGNPDFQLPMSSIKPANTFCFMSVVVLKLSFLLAERDLTLGIHMIFASAQLGRCDAERVPISPSPEKRDYRHVGIKGKPVSEKPTSRDLARVVT